MDPDSARAIAERHLRDALPKRWLHVQAVAAFAENLASLTPYSTDDVVAAAWLHDIGYSPDLSETGFHPLDGARHLRAEGWTDAICTLVANHTNAGHQAEELGLRADLEREFPDTPSVDRDILWAADAQTGPSGQRFTLDERVNEVVDRYGPDDVVSRCMLKIKPDLAAAIERVEQGIRRAIRQPM